MFYVLISGEGNNTFTLWMKAEQHHIAFAHFSENQKIIFRKSFSIWIGRALWQAGSL